MSGPKVAALRRTPTALLEAFWQRVAGVIGSDEPSVLAVRAARAETVVRLYYVYLMAYSYGLIDVAAKLRKEPVQPRLDLLLTSWVPVDSWRQIAAGLSLLMIVAAMVAATIPRWRIPRVAAIGSFLLLEAMKFDLDGKISHATLVLVWIGIAFCFLPSSRSDSSERCRNYLASFLGAQVVVCLLYTCSGVSKLVGVALDWNSGVTWLDPEALPLMLAASWAPPKLVLAWEFLVLNPWAAWLSNIGVLYLEIGALFAVFRRRLHRPWAIGLLIMHAMIWLTMSVQFMQSAFAVALILLVSPFAPDKLDLKRVFFDLPIVRFVYRRFRARREAGVDGDPPAESSERAPWLPSSAVMRLWIPVLVVVYVSVAFGNFDQHGGFEPGSRQRRSRPGGEVYPISPLPMFMRMPSNENNVKKLKRIRRQLKRAKEGRVGEQRRTERPQSQPSP